MILAEKLLPARVERVHSANRVELEIDLGFGVRIRRTFVLDGMNTDALSEQTTSRAVHALVVLIGGKSVLVMPEHTRQDARHGSLYLNERLHGTPVGFVADVPGLSRPILDVATFFNWLAAQNFDIRIVRSIVHGRRDGRPEDA